MFYVAVALASITAIYLIGKWEKEVDVEHEANKRFIKEFHNQKIAEMPLSAFTELKNILTENEIKVD